MEMVLEEDVMEKKNPAALAQKHERLEASIEEEYSRPNPDALRVAELKRRKLRIKDRIAALEK